MQPVHRKFYKLIPNIYGPNSSQALGCVVQGIKLNDDQCEEGEGE